MRRFLAEARGSMNSLDIRPIEKTKIDCAKKISNEKSTSKEIYNNVNSYQTLLYIMNKL